MHGSAACGTVAHTVRTPAWLPRVPQYALPYSRCDAVPPDHFSSVCGAVQVHEDAVLPCRLAPYEGKDLRGDDFMKRQIQVLKTRPQGKV